MRTTSCAGRLALASVTLAAAACRIPDKVPGGDDDDDGSSDARPLDAAGPSLAFDDDTLDLGVVIIDGLASGGEATTLRNSGGATATGLTFEITPAGAGAVVGHNCNGSLAANATCMVAVNFDPATVGTFSYTLTVSSDQGATDALSASGFGGARVVMRLNAIPFDGTAATGTITSTPPGLSCTSGGQDCFHTFTSTPITLTAAIDAPATMDDWGIAGCQTDRSCTVNLTASIDVAVATIRAPVRVIDGVAVDQAEGVALANDGTIILVGSRSNRAVIERVNPTTGVLSTEQEYAGASVRTFRDVSVAPSGVLGLSGDATGNLYDAWKSEVPANLGAEAAVYRIEDGGQDYGLAVTHDSASNLYMVGEQSGVMFWGRWAPNTATITAPSFLHSTPMVAGSALDVVWDAGTLWVVGRAGSQGWIGKFTDTGTVAASPAPINPSGMDITYGVAALGGGDIVVVGRGTPDSTVLVRRYSPALVAGWTHTYTLPATVAGAAIGIDPGTGNVYVAATTASACELRKLDKTTGDLLFARTPYAGYCESLAVNADGVVVAGYEVVGGDRNITATRFVH